MWSREKGRSAGARKGSSITVEAGYHHRDREMTRHFTPVWVIKEGVGYNHIGDQYRWKEGGIAQGTQSNKGERENRSPYRLYPLGFRGVTASHQGAEKRQRGGGYTGAIVVMLASCLSRGLPLNNCADKRSVPVSFSEIFCPSKKDGRSTCRVRRGARQGVKNINPWTMDEHSFPSVIFFLFPQSTSASRSAP
ncbi:hypothetical protein Naga_100348g4 [Nannochloropsis gaditana]|uniref:Uncharacterized protein n=1 Tax=Nannochloropsis gaditana TaxID=72520 RepID=W7TMI9_9STRA|nr:hypothetical protein Naga_100348g4 [Nannochloropsis gaditana]